MSNTSDPIHLTRDEYRNITRCLGDENFRMLFAEYCSELSDPENRIQYEKELKMLEAERGYEVKFIKPVPGYVIKTTTQENNKIFINVCHSDLVSKPESKATRNGNGQKGLEWSIPYAQIHPRKDYDNRKNECIVYDVVFHYDTLHLAKQNANFRKLVTDTAIDAVESSFDVPLYKNNLKFPKLQYKGVPKMSIIRQKAIDSSNQKHQVAEKNAEKNDINDNTDNKENISNATNKEYITPKYKLVHAKSVDCFEITNERNNSVLKPDEIVIEVQLPLLNTASSCVLNIAQQELHLISQEPARYKLQVKLPFEVSEKNGSAKFNTDEKTLIISLPVIKSKTLKPNDTNNIICTYDSQISQKCETLGVKKNKLNESLTPMSTVKNNFENRKKLFPKFATNKMDNIFAFTLNVRNVDPASIEVEKGIDTVKCEFSNIGSGFFPSYYVFFARFPNANICDIEYEEWKNCLVLKVILDSSQLECYNVGVDKGNLTEYSIMEHITDKKNKFGKEIEDDSLCIAVSKSSTKQERKVSNMSIEIKTKPISDSECIIMEDENAGEEDKTDKSMTSPEIMQKHDITEVSGSLDADVNATGDNAENVQEMKKQKRHSRKKHKKRSLSESCCDQLKVILENEIAKMEPEQVQNKQSAGEEDDVYPEKQQRKGRSVSESCSLEPETSKAKENNVVTNALKSKGILKYASLERSISECSDDHYFASSIDSSSVNNSLDQQNSYLSDSCRKTVRFNEFIKTKLFRSNTSILAQKKKNAKKNESKRRALSRRLSEGESTDNDDKDNVIGPNAPDAEVQYHEHDSGISLHSDAESSGGNDLEADTMEGEDRGARKKVDVLQSNPIDIVANVGGKSKENSSKKPKTSRCNAPKHHKGSNGMQFKSEMIFDIEV